jgi:hypothetical protein
MKIIQMSCILIVILLLTAPSDILASDFSCGSKMISLGDYQYDVLNKCGEPSHVEVWERVRIRRDSVPRLLETDFGGDLCLLLVKELIKVEEWEYNLGPTRFIRYLRFENGRLIRITEGDYGY